MSSLQAFVADGFDEAERQLFEFVLDLRHAQAVGDRGIDVEGLLRDTLPPVLGHVLQRSHVVQAIRQLDEDDANIVDHRQQHLAEVLDLPFFARRQRDGPELGHALDDVGHVAAETLAQRVRGGQGVFQHVVQQPGGHADGIELHAGQDVGHLERVHQVWLAGMAHLPLVLEG